MIRFENVSKALQGRRRRAARRRRRRAEGRVRLPRRPVRLGEVDLPAPPAPRGAAHGGRIVVAGRDISRMSHWKVPQLRRNIGTIFQDFKLLPTKTVYENVAFAMEVIGRPRNVIRTQVPQVLDLVGLAKKAGRFPNELSGGEQQRVSIARAFVNRPLILLADEPTGNLDPATTVGIMRILDRINRTGTTIVMATHDQRIVDAMRRRVIELDRGSVVRDEARGVYGTGASRDVDAARLLLARDDRFAASQPADDDRGHPHRRGVARAVRRDHDALAVGRPRHRADQGWRAARDLHEGRRDAGPDRRRPRRAEEGSRRSSRSSSSTRRPRTRSSSGSSARTPTW